MWLKEDYNDESDNHKSFFNMLLTVISLYVGLSTELYEKWCINSELLWCCDVDHKTDELFYCVIEVNINIIDNYEHFYLKHKIQDSKMFRTDKT